MPPTPTPELDLLISRWTNHAPNHDSWANSLPVVKVDEVTSQLDTWSWAFQVGSLSIARNVNVKNIERDSDMLAIPLPGIERIHRVFITRPLPLGSAVRVASSNVVVIVPPGAITPLWAIELGCSHLNTAIESIGNLVETYTCADCQFTYEVDHGD